MYRLGLILEFLSIQSNQNTNPYQPSLGSHQRGPNQLCVLWVLNMLQVGKRL